ncbi:mitochondrial protein Pet127-domain-containing protein [Syncephalis fuscata]|nr:mitochondrial protein Pet127-domain-containing protein [Syncephalis fuscata]
MYTALRTCRPFTGKTCQQRAWFGNLRQRIESRRANNHSNNSYLIEESIPQLKKPQFVEQIEKRRAIENDNNDNDNIAAYSTSQSRDAQGIERIELISALPYTYRPVTPLNKHEIPRLAHGLEGVLSKKGVCFLQDPKTSLYNYSQFLESIPPQSDFNYNMINPFIKPSSDTTLRQLALDHKKRFVASTSSMTSALSQIYFVISQWKQAQMSDLSKDFADEPRNFTRLTTAPMSIMLKWKDGVHALDSDDAFKKETILTSLGHSLERFLTHTPEDYAKYSITNGSNSNEIVEPLSYNYAKMEDFILRSQLDCYDESLPKKTFDLKTRAVVAIRMDYENYTEYEGYRIRQLAGLYESFEREYYDMVRAPMLKYNFQVRIGNMDGIFVAYHNTFRMYGFQYISMKEMDERLFGNTRTGDQVFSLCVKVLSRLFQAATQKFPDKTLRLVFNARRRESLLEVFVETVDETSSSPATDQPIKFSNAMGANPFLIDYNTTPFGTIVKKPANQLAKFSIDFKSLINDELAHDAVTLNEKSSDVWKLQFHLKEIVNHEAILRQEYNNIYDSMYRRSIPEEEKDNNEAAAKKLSGLVRKLRKISQSQSQ